MKRIIIQLLVLLGFFVCAQNALAQTPAVYTVKRGDIAGRIILRYTEKASNWSKSWVKVTSPAGKIRADKNRIYPGDQVFIESAQVKTAPVAAGNQNLIEFCAQYVNADCVKTLSGINEIKNARAEISGQIFVPKDFILAPIAQPAPRKPAGPSPISKWTIFGLIGILALIIIGILCADSVALSLQRLLAIKLTTPRMAVPHNPFAGLGKHRKEKLALIRNDIIHRVSKTGALFDASQLETQSILSRIVYRGYKPQPEIPAALSQIEEIYGEAKAKISYTTGIDGLNHMMIAVMKFPDLGSVNLERLRKIGIDWLNPEMRGFADRFIASFKQRQSNEFNAEPHNFSVAMRPEQGVLTIEITRNDQIRPPSADFIRRKVIELNDPRFQIDSLTYRHATAVLVLTLHLGAETNERPHHLENRAG